MHVVSCGSDVQVSLGAVDFISNPNRVVVQRMWGPVATAGFGASGLWSYTQVTSSFSCRKCHNSKVILLLERIMKVTTTLRESSCQTPCQAWEAVSVC